MLDSIITDQILKDQFQNLVQQTLVEEESLLEKSQYFFQDNNAVIKKKI